MNMVKVKEIYMTYKTKAKSEEYTNDKTLDICNAAEKVISLHGQVYSNANNMAFNDIVTKFDTSVKELESLIDVF